MRILLLGRKNIAKAEEILRGLGALGHRVDHICFPAFAYLGSDREWDSSFGPEVFPEYRRAGSYYAGSFFRILGHLAHFARGKEYDLFFAIDTFEAVILLLYRFFSCSRAKVLYYGYDYQDACSVFSLRYVLNRFDRWATRNADIVWNVSEGIERARERSGVHREGQVTVPLGIEDTGLAWDPKEEKHFLFVGSFKEGHNLLRMVSIFSELVQKDARYRLTLVGRGKLEDRIVGMVRDLGMEKYIFLRGYVSAETLRREISEGKYVCGVAIYEDIPALLCQDPGKIKDYLAWHMPVLMTGYHSGSGILRECNLGYVASDDNEETLCKCFEKVTCDDVRLKQRSIARYVREQSFAKVLSRYLSAVSVVRNSGE